MAQKITLLATQAAIEDGTGGIFTLNLSSPAPAGGLTVSYNMAGSSATLNSDYTLLAGDNIKALTADSFVIAAGATTASLTVSALADSIKDDNEQVSLHLSIADAGSNKLNFASQKTFAVGVFPWSSDVGDFNQDGNVDIVTANSSGNTVSLLLGNGQGDFSLKGNFAVGTGPDALTVSDIDNDGYDDVLTSNYSDSTISLLRGNGKGGFAAQEIVSVGLGPYAISTADLNNDGYVDAVTANWLSNTVSVVLSGQFTQNTFAVGGYPDALKLADINHDSFVDVVVLNSGSNNISVLLGKGNGNFAVQKTFAVGLSPTSLSLADVNQDGNVDVVTTNYVDNTLSVLLGKGDGSFAKQNSIATDAYPFFVQLFDVDTDERLDAVIAHSDSDSVSVLHGDGAGGFSHSQAFAVGFLPTSISIADVNSDDLPDVISANGSASNVSVLINHTTASTQTLSSSLNIIDVSNHLPTGTVSISDTTPEQNQTLTASHNLQDADGLGAISYSWSSGGVIVATGNSYRPTAADIGKSLRVMASYTDGKGETEQISSSATAAVTQAATAGFNIAPLNGTQTSEDGSQVDYAVSLKTAPLPNQDVTLIFASSDTSEGTIAQTKLVFNTANYATPQTLSVRGVDDSDNDGDVAYFVSGKVSTIDVFYKALTIAALQLVNRDDGRDVPLDLYGDEGGSKIDVMTGGTGADKLHGLNMADNLSGGAGNDSLWGGYGDDNLFGEDGDDKLYGEQENDYMDGGLGNDTLDGGEGEDSMMGGAGNDTYILGYDAVDVINDKGLNSDVDSVIMPYQLTRYTLPNGIENGTINAGFQPSNLTGNSSNNKLTGNDGNNQLDGSTGSDVLTGNGGKDSFLFDSALKVGIDRITDFSPKYDRIQLDDAIFKNIKTGVLKTTEFNIGTAASDNNDHIIYNKTTGALLYDDDGAGGHAAVQIATLGVKLAVSATDFLVV